MYSLPVALHVSALQVAGAEGDLTSVAGERVGGTRCHASHDESCRLKWYTDMCGWVESGAQCSKDDERRDKKCLEGQTFRCKPCHLFQISSVRNAAIAVLRSCLTAKPSTLSPRPTFHLHSVIFHLSLVFVGSSFVRLTLDQSLLSQLDSELHHLSTNQTLRFHVCRSLIRIASRCFDPHVPINTFDNLGYGCMIASFFCLLLYYYGHSVLRWPIIFADMFISPS